MLKTDRHESIDFNRMTSAFLKLLRVCINYIRAFKSFYCWAGFVGRRSTVLDVNANCYRHAAEAAPAPQRTVLLSNSRVLKVAHADL